METGNRHWMDNLPEIQNCSTVIETLVRKQKQEAKAKSPTRNTKCLLN
jgi:hypothetical protein